MMSEKKRSNGFTLIEVLIGVFVLTIGLLGIAGLQTVAKTSNFEAIQRTTAVMLAEDIAERMRANPSNLDAYVVGNDTPITVNTGTALPAPACTSAAPCTPAQMATFDLYQWEQAIIGATDQSAGSNTGGLAEPSACITAGATTGEYTIAIAWRGKTPLSNPAASICGAGTGFYDAASGAAGNNLHRRLLTLNVRITR